MKKPKEVHGYGVTYQRYVNHLGKNILLMFVYYEGELVESRMWCNGEQMPI